MIFTFEDAKDLATRLDRCYRVELRAMTPNAVFEMLQKAETQNLRAEFAARAMQSLLRNPDYTDADVIAKVAFQLADVMLEKMEKDSKEKR